MKRPVGIDLGTTFSVIAVVNEAGMPEVLRNREGAATTPSVVMFHPDEPQPVVGAEAKNLAPAMPNRVVEAAKRFMGTDATWEIDGHVYGPSDISALILKKLKDDAEESLGEPVEDAVVTVPAYFAEAEREATRRAAELAGLNVLMMINEPTAAAIAYRVQKQSQSQTVLVYDLGGGTFDVTLMQVNPQGIDVLGTEGDVQLGGKDWDALLMDHVAAQFKAQHGLDPCEDDEACQCLAAVSETAKHSLSQRAKVSIPCRVGSQAMHVEVTRDEFEAMSTALLERTRATVDIVMDRAKMAHGQVDRVLLVGGSTRMPMVRRMLENMFPERVDSTIEPDECVAAGAALKAAMVSLRGLPSGKAPARWDRLKSLQVRDITAHSLATAVLTDGELAASFIITKDSPIPAEQMRDDYVTTKANQDSLVVPVLQGESRDPRANTLLACYEFKGIPPRPAGMSRLAVTFRYNESGQVEVEAKDTESGRQLTRAEYPIDTLDELVGSEPGPLLVVLLVDTSYSMIGPPLRHAKEAAAGFLEQLQSECATPSGRPPKEWSPAKRSAALDVKLGVVEFGSDTRPVVEFQDDPNDAAAAIQGMIAGNGTPMDEGIDMARAMLKAETGRRAMVLLTDGAPDDKDRTRASAAQARSDGISIVAIRLPGADQGFLDEICTPGMKSRSVTDAAQLSQEFANLAGELAAGVGLKAM